MDHFDPDPRFQGVDMAAVIIWIAAVYGDLYDILSRCEHFQGNSDFDRRCLINAQYFRADSRADPRSILGNKLKTEG